MKIILMMNKYAKEIYLYMIQISNILSICTLFILFIDIVVVNKFNSIYSLNLSFNSLEYYKLLYIIHQYLIILLKTMVVILFTFVVFIL